MFEENWVYGEPHEGSNGQLASKQSIMAQSKKIQTKVTVTKPLSRHCYRIHYLMIGKRLAGNHK
jgi:hypothetical protein